MPWMVNHHPKDGHQPIQGWLPTIQNLQGVPKLVIRFLFAHSSSSKASRNEILGTMRMLVLFSFQKVQDLNYRS